MQIYSALVPQLLVPLFSVPAPRVLPASRELFDMSKHVPCALLGLVPWAGAGTRTPHGTVWHQPLPNAAVALLGCTNTLLCLCPSLIPLLLPIPWAQGGSCELGLKAASSPHVPAPRAPAHIPVSRSEHGTCFTPHIYTRLCSQPQPRLRDSALPR